MSDLEQISLNLWRKKAMNNSPCLTCNRVADPSDCQNKNCVQWKTWWLDRWEQIRKQANVVSEKTSTEDKK